LQNIAIANTERSSRIGNDDLSKLAFLTWNS